MNFFSKRSVSVLNTRISPLFWGITLFQLSVLFCVVAQERYSTLIPVYSIEQASSNVNVSYKPEYDDTEQYGELPGSESFAELEHLNSVTNWLDSQTFGIRSNKKAYVARVRDAFVSSSQLGTVFDAQQQFLFSLWVKPQQPIFWPITPEVFSYKRQHVGKLATVQGPTLFYHTVIDRLPSIFLMRNLLMSDSEIKVMINAITRIPDYLWEYLDLLGIPRERCVEGDYQTIFSANEVYFATPFLMEPIPRKLLLSLRNTLLTAAAKKPLSRSYRNNLIVVVQRRERDRRIANIHELVALLRESFAGKDYEIVIYDASMSVAEQICLFNNARLVISPMASGLTNVLYTKEDATIIELHPQRSYITDASRINNYGGEWCWWLASAVGARYCFIALPYYLSDFSLICPLERIRPMIQKVINNWEQ